MKDEFNYDGILQHVCTSLKDKLDISVFVGSRPAAVKDAMNAFAVVSLGSGITDGGDTYQTSAMLISLFARDRQGGVENTTLLGNLVKSCASLFPVDSELYIALKPKMLYSGSDTMGFHAASLQVSLIIKK